MKTITIGEKEYELRYAFESFEFLQDELEVEGIYDVMKVVYDFVEVKDKEKSKGKSKGIDLLERLPRFNLKKLKLFIYAGLMHTALTPNDIENHFKRIDDFGCLLPILTDIVTSTSKVFTTITKGKSGKKN